MNIVEELRAQANQHPLDADLTMFDVAASEIENLEQQIKKLEFMIDNGLGWEDLHQDFKTEG